MTMWLSDRRRLTPWRDIQEPNAAPAARFRAAVRRSLFSPPSLLTAGPPHCGGTASGL